MGSYVRCLDQPVEVQKGDKVKEWRHRLGKDFEWINRGAIDSKIGVEVS